MLCRSLFILYLLVIALSVLLRFTDSVYPFGIFKLGLFRKWNCITHSSYNKQTNRSRFGNKTCCPRCRLVIRLSKKKSWYWIPKFKVHFWCRRKIAKWNLTRKTYMSKRSVYVQFTITCTDFSKGKPVPQNPKIHFFLERFSGEIRLLCLRLRFGIELTLVCAYS